MWFYLFSYRQNISVNFVSGELAFKSLDDCYAFLEPFGITYADGSRESIDCKSSTSALANIWISPSSYTCNVYNKQIERDDVNLSIFVLENIKHTN